MQPKPRFIGHPDFHRPILWQLKLFEVLLQFGAERRRGRRILFDVAGTRNPERAAHFSQPIIK